MKIAVLQGIINGLVEKVRIHPKLNRLVTERLNHIRNDGQKYLSVERDVKSIAPDHEQTSSTFFFVGSDRFRFTLDQPTSYRRRRSTMVKKSDANKSAIIWGTLIWEELFTRMSINWRNVLLHFPQPNRKQECIIRLAKTRQTSSQIHLKQSGKTLWASLGRKPEVNRIDEHPLPRGGRLFRVLARDQVHQVWPYCIKNRQQDVKTHECLDESTHFWTIQYHFHHRVLCNFKFVYDTNGMK